MKNKKMNYGKFLMVLLLTITIVGCSSNDDPSTFLETHANKSYYDSTAKVYIKLKNSLAAPLESWSLEGACYDYNNFSIATLEVIENSANALILKYSEGDEIVTISFSIANTKLTATVNTQGESPSQFIYTFDLTSEDLGNLPICA